MPRRFWFGKRWCFPLLSGKDQELLSGLHRQGLKPTSYTLGNSRLHPRGLAVHQLYKLLPFPSLVEIFYRPLSSVAEVL